MTVVIEYERRRILAAGPEDPSWRMVRNICPECHTNDHLERRNYDIMWGDADLYCGKCNVKIRGMDFG